MKRMNCRPKPGGKGAKMCPAAKRLRRELAVAAVDEGCSYSEAARVSGYASYVSVRAAMEVRA